MVVTFKGRPFDGESVDCGTALLFPPGPAEMHQFQVLLHQIRSALAEHSQEPELLSIRFDFPMVDLLALWESLSPQEAPYAYWEQPHPSFRILAVGQVVSIETRGTQRFQEAQRELQRWQRSMLPIFATGAIAGSTGSTTGSNQGNCATTPPWLASFTFFDDWDFSDRNLGDRTQELNGKNLADTPDPFVAPFMPGWIWLPRWQVCRWPDRCELWVHSRLPGIHVVDQSDTLEKIVRSAWGVVQHLKDQISHEPTAGHSPLHFAAPFVSPLVPSTTQLDRFGRGVEAVLEGMQRGPLQKVVLAHNLEVQVQKPFNVRQSLQNLRYSYPDCHLFCWTNAQGTNFIGASPERLLRLSQRQLQTEALAGSAPRGSTLQEAQQFAQGLLSNPKERHEHQLVVDFIMAQLQVLGISPQRSNLPKVRQLSHIQHLHTDIAATLTPRLHPLEVLAKLHPTPAVAGVPRDLACDYIRQYEPFDRSLYASPLGWIDGSGNCEFIVGIRSAILHHDRARLMAGAGIVQGSVPQREIAEVELKLQTILRSLA